MDSARPPDPPLPPPPMASPSPSVSSASAFRRPSHSGPRPAPPHPSPHRSSHHASPSMSSIHHHQARHYAETHFQPPSPSPSLHRRHSHGSRRSNQSEIVLPEWQPDASVKSCPICTSLFTFWNRRHHCRKCGRVVCASCSPNRITIPKAFVVRPPPPLLDDLDTQQAERPSNSNSRRSWTPAELLQGEQDSEALEVRICDECLGRRTTATPNPGGGHASSSRSVSNPMPYRADASSSVAVPQNAPPREPSRRRRQSVQGGRSLPHPHHAQMSPTSRRHHPPQPYSSMLPPPPPPPQQPRLRETDFCPICTRPLPTLSDPSEAGREAHIQSCIAAATAPATPPAAAVPQRNTPAGRNRSYTNGGRMVVWRASEKDCRDPHGGIAECVICFEDFEEGTEIARLECLCRYHKKCIRDWFDRKGNGECPVHAVHE